MHVSSFLYFYHLFQMSNSCGVEEDAAEEDETLEAVDNLEDEAGVFDVVGTVN